MAKKKNTGKSTHTSNDARPTVQILTKQYEETAARAAQDARGPDRAALQILQGINVRDAVSKIDQGMAAEKAAKAEEEQKRQEAKQHATAQSHAQQLGEAVGDEEVIAQASDALSDNDGGIGVQAAGDSDVQHDDHVNNPLNQIPLQPLISRVSATSASGNSPQGLPVTGATGDGGPAGPIMPANRADRPLSPREGVNKDNTRKSGTAGSKEHKQPSMLIYAVMATEILGMSYEAYYNGDKVWKFATETHSKACIMATLSSISLGLLAGGLGGVALALAGPFLCTVGYRLPDNVKEVISNDQISPQSVLTYGTLFGSTVLKFQNPVVPFSAILVQEHFEKGIAVKAITAHPAECTAGILIGAVVGGAIGSKPGVLSGVFTGAALCVLSYAKYFGNTQLDASVDALSEPAQETKKDEVVKQATATLTNNTKSEQNSESEGNNTKELAYDAFKSSDSISGRENTIVHKAIALWEGLKKAGVENVLPEQILPVLESYQAGMDISHEHQLVISSIKTNICTLSQDLVGTNVGNWLIENNFLEGAVCGKSEISSTEAGSAL